jgi:HSP20 family protein
MPETLPARKSGGLSTWLGRDPFRSLREEMDDVLSRFSTESEGGWFGRDIVPSLDLSETNGSCQIKMDLPGVKPDEVNIEISGDTVRISGEHTEEREEKDKTYHRTERRTGSFSRSVTLPCRINEEKVTAECREGVLTIKLPKTEESRTRKVKVKG